MKKLRIKEHDYLKAHRKASREEELTRHGRPAACRAVHKSKKTYDRKHEKAGLRNLPFCLRGACGWLGQRVVRRGGRWSAMAECWAEVAGAVCGTDGMGAEQGGQ